MNIQDLKGNYTVQSGSGTGIPASKSVTPAQAKSLGQKILDTGTDISNFFGGKGVADEFGATIARAKAPENQKNAVDFPTMKEVVGSDIQLGANLIPGAGPEAGLATKVALGGATGAAFDLGNKLQNPDAKVGAATAVGAVLPVAGAAIKFASPFVGRLFRGVGSGLSGVPSETIDQIVSNPETAQKVSQQIAKNGGDKVLEDNARTILNGVSKIKNESSANFAKGLDELKTTDINPTLFRQQTQDFLDRHGISTENGTRNLSGVEFDDPKNLQKASDLIDRLHSTELDGKSLRKLSDDIESAKFKTATSDERLSFNSFIGDLAKTVKNAVVKSTDKLTEINAAYSQDRQLADAVQNIFGEVNFKNLPEVVKASQKLEGLFNQKGLQPKVVDDFMKRIGVNPADFRTSEAVRQIGNKSEGANSVGLSLGEMARSVTSAVVTPKMVKDIAIKTGLAEQKVVPFLKQLSKPARNLFLNALLKAGN